MKKNGFIAFAMTISALGSVHADAVNSRKETIAANYATQAVAVRVALNEVGSRFGYQIFFADADLQGLQVEKNRLQFKSFAESLSFFRKYFPLDFMVQGNVVTVRKVHQAAQQQSMLKGKVLDSERKPIAGVSIEFLNSSYKTRSGADGSFAIAVPTSGDRLLLASHLAYEGARIVIGSETYKEIILTAVNQSLDEVVVIGYGQQARSKVVGAVSKISSDELEKVSSVSFEQQLAGKVAGVVVNQSNGQPGAGGDIVIRGRGTLTAGANPLIVVDGFPLTEGSTLNAINPHDIADINILKDAASAAIYGSRAANGVILVTTKQGTIGQERVTVDFDAYYGVQQQTSGVKYVDGYQFAQFLKEARDWGYVSKDPANRSASDPNSIRVTKKIKGKNIDGRELSLDYLNPYLNGESGLTNTDWMDVAFRNAPIANYNLSFKGGGEKSKFYTSLGYFDQKGVVIGTDLQRYSASVNLNTKLSDKIDFGIHMKPSYTHQNSQDQASRSNGALGLLPLSFPFYSPYKVDGSLNISEQLIMEQRLLEGVAINGTPVENLLATSTLVQSPKRRFKTFGNIYANYRILDGLTYRFTLGGDYDTYQSDHYYPMSLGAYRIPAPRPDADGNQVRENMFNYLVENTLNYSFKTGQHSFDILAGHTFQKERADYNKVIGTGYADDNISNIGGASSFRAEPHVNAWTLESYLSRLQYDYAGRYLLSAAIRRDGSSRFGENNRWGNFPSLSLGWVISQEDFFPKGGLISFAKIAGSWGKTGNNQIGNYGSHALVTFDNYVNGANLAPGYTTTTAPNANLGWEIANSRNIGLDMGFFKNKLNAALAYYKTNTRDLLLNVPVPQQTGYNTVLANIGEMENQGFEAQLSGKGFYLGAVRMGFNANLTTYKNKVLALGPGQQRIATGTDQNFVTAVGGSIAEIYGYTLDGVFKTQEEIDNTPHLDGTLLGDYRVRDMNGDGVIDERDKTSKGTYAPKLTYGFGAEFFYKGFDLAFDFNGLSGRTLMDGDMASLTESGEGFALPTTYYFENRYHPENNPNGFLGQPNFGNFSNSRKLVRSSAVVERNNGDYLRLRNVRIGYTFTAEALRRLKLTQMNVYLSGNNIFTKTDFRGWNPDGTSSNILTSGYNTGGNYPVARTFTLGIKVTY
ncbi:SusC/RagA family TonB-linked outer membrane protein [Sphingobacterium yanglingense]|uniref:TonB-linked SusC/RagA family outer membrane protein n=1 Tax=Sphingobacterium yanglingense TaxID=1437280 RepID=A0A4R6WH16_9SPHI|nr:TonB-dependent receptor [Sphingobacterium yanglingense]TDQ79470.1 TonB-linked SusC/RagA family outer membrane protein [Sphingobacterium yanglingense]